MTKAYDPREDWPSDVTTDTVPPRTTPVRPTAHAVDIELNSGGSGRVAVDGVDVSALTTSLVVFADPKFGPKVVLELASPLLKLASDAAAVDIGSETRDFLAKLGWTPPAAPKVPVAEGSNGVQD